MKGILWRANFQLISPISAGLTNKKWSFILEYLLKYICIAIILERGSMVFLWKKGRAFLLLTVKGLTFLSSGFLVCNALYKPTFIWVQSLTSMGPGNKESLHIEYDDIYAPEMWESWVQSLGWEDPLEKEMATYSSILVWRIPWTV